ncbi:MAG: aldo/keto reductase [Eubacteriales bacterium]
MRTVTLGRTGIISPATAIGALPIQRIAKEEAGRLLRIAYDAGITFFDTARAYSDSESKICYALKDVRDKIFIATKLHAATPEAFRKSLETSLTTLGTDYIDIYQFHNPSFCPKPEDGTNLYEEMLRAKAEGKIRYIGITSHRLDIANEAVNSGLYDTLQYPFSYLADEKDAALVKLCGEKNIGFICMKAMSGGLITRSDAAAVFIAQYLNALPIWGIQTEKELREFISYMENPPAFTDEIKTLIERDRIQLSGNFCRACGYCLPCAAGIDIPTCARIALLLNRAPYQQFLTPEFSSKIEKVDLCTGCGHCLKHCPYGLNTPELLRTNYDYYKKFALECADHSL